MISGTDSRPENIRAVAEASLKSLTTDRIDLFYQYGIFQNELLSSLAAKHNRMVAQVILRWLAQRGVVAIPKSVRTERMAENVALFDHRDPNMVKWLGERKIHDGTERNENGIYKAW